MVNHTVNKAKDKSVMFFSASSPRHAKEILDAGIDDLLVSFHYIKKSPKYTEELIPRVNARGGYFMTDSGGFSIITALKGDEIPEEVTQEKYWTAYIEEYVQWLYDNHKNIYVCANMDLDNIVGRDVVDKWNEQYFKPLEKYTNVIYLAHKDVDKEFNDPTGFKRLKEYLEVHDYVGVNNRWKNDYQKVYQLAKHYKKRIHGFALTSVPELKKFPQFSQDSTSWMGGARYGTTYDYDGKNFVVQSHHKKYVRKTKKLLCRERSIDFSRILAEKEHDINMLNLEGWKGARHEVLKMANLKLWNKPVSFYDKRTK